MTIYEIKRLTAATSPCFFTRSTLAFFGQRMRDFTVTKQSDGRYEISALMKDSDRVVRGWTIRYFNPANNELERE